MFSIDSQDGLSANNSTPWMTCIYIGWLILADISVSDIIVEQWYLDSIFGQVLIQLIMNHPSRACV